MTPEKPAYRKVPRYMVRACVKSRDRQRTKQFYAPHECQHLGTTEHNVTAEVVRAVLMPYRSM